VVGGVPARVLCTLDDYLARWPQGRGRLVPYGLPGHDSPERARRAKQGRETLDQAAAALLADDAKDPRR
jgi:hypothetical protein